MSSDVMQHELVERARETGALTKADITRAWFIYWLGAEVSNSYERLQSLIFCASMTPIIKKLYPQKEEQVEALKRHLNFFNSEQTFGAVIQGISIAMEEQKTRGEPISDASITGIKTGLMGPLAGMGDSIVWAAVMPLLIAIFIPFAANGSAFGGIAPLILYPAITLAIMTFQSGWNSFMWPLIVLNSDKMKTVQVGLATFQYQYDTQYGPLMAGTVIATLPMVLLFLFAQKYYVEGIAFSGGK